MDDKKKIELNDEELEKVVGGFEIGDHARANSRSIRYCPGCGKLAMYSYGTVVGKRGMRETSFTSSISKRTAADMWNGEQILPVRSIDHLVGLN